jgi:hypothetical protein
MASAATVWITLAHGNLSATGRNPAHDPALQHGNAAAPL